MSITTKVTASIEPRTITIGEFLDTEEQLNATDGQRRVAWGAENVERLFEDLEEFGGRAIRPDKRWFGVVKLQPRNSESPEDLTYVDVVDGQQRLVTSLLTISWIAKSYEEEFNKPGRAEALRDRYLRVGDETPQPKLRLTPLDDDEFQMLIDDPEQSTENQQLTEVTAAIGEELHTRVDTIDDLIDLEEQFIEGQVVCRVNFSQGYSRFRIFEETNGRGEDITPVDRIKNRVMEIAEEDGSVDFESVEDEWYRLRIALQELDEVRAVRYIVMTMEEVETRSKLGGKDLYPRVKEIVDHELDDVGLSLNEYVTILADAAEIYRDVVTPDLDYTDDQSVNAEINRHLSNLDAIGAAPAYLLALGAIYRGMDPDDLVEILMMAEKYSFARRLVDRRIPQEIRAYLGIIHGEDETKPSLLNASDPVAEVRDVLADGMPSDEEVKREFTTKQWKRNDLTRYVLATIEHEAYRSRSRAHDGFGGPHENASIEHIIPRRFTAKKYKRWRNYLSADEEELAIDVDRAGNLTLLEERQNPRAGTDPFNQKVKNYYTTSNYEMTTQLANDYSDWGLAQVDDRAQLLAELAVDIWSIN